MPCLRPRGTGSCWRGSQSLHEAANEWKIFFNCAVITVLLHHEKNFCEGTAKLNTALRFMVAHPAIWHVEPAKINQQLRNQLIVSCTR